MLVEQSGGVRWWFIFDQVLNTAKSNWGVFCWRSKFSVSWGYDFKLCFKNCDGRHGLQVIMESSGEYKIGREAPIAQTATGRRLSGSGSDVALVDGALNGEERARKVLKPSIATKVFGGVVGECDLDTGTELESLPLNTPLVGTAAPLSVPMMSELFPAGENPLTPTTA